MVEPCPPFPPPDLTLTQPWATVGAAFVAVIGALIAYAGVTKTARSTRRETRRKEQVDVLTAALTALQDFTRAILRIAITTDQSERNNLIRELNNSGRMEELQSATSLAAGKLMLYGFDNVRGQIDPTSTLLANLWELIRDKPATVVDIEDVQTNVNSAAVAIQQAFSKLK